MAKGDRFIRNKEGGGAVGVWDGEIVHFKTWNEARKWLSEKRKKSNFSFREKTGEEKTPEYKGFKESAKGYLKGIAKDPSTLLYLPIAAIFHAQKEMENKYKDFLSRRGK